MNRIFKLNIPSRWAWRRLGFSLLLGLALTLSMVEMTLAGTETKVLPERAPDSIPNGPGTVEAPAYAKVTKPNVPVYAHPEDARVGLPPIRVLGTGSVWVSLAETEPVYIEDQAWYHINSKGYIQADYLKISAASQFNGMQLSESGNRVLAWTVTSTRPASEPGGKPDKYAPLLSRYTPLTVYEERQSGGWTWYRIDEDQWIEQRQLGLVKQAPRPEQIGPDEKWIEVNLFEQTMAAYEGDRIVYATLISSGKAPWYTPTGLFRVWAKVAQSKMSGRAGYPDSYFLENVPWILYFKGSVGFHGAYWHDRFGTPQSHGCVNLSTEDARWLFNWATPTAISGWTVSTPQNPGTWVWVHR